MKDYFLEAQKVGIQIYRRAIDDTYVESYKLTDDNNYVMIKYLNGQTHYSPVSTTSLEALDLSQRSALEEIKRKVSKEGKTIRALNSGIVALDLMNVILQSANQNWIASACWLACTSIYSLRIYQPYKLMQELNLVSWIVDNKDDVNKVIKDEVNQVISKPTNASNSINMPSYNYPSNLVSYSKTMYEEGINLNNIDELSNKELKKLKKKVLKKERGQ